MALSNTLKQIVKQEIQSDPENIGYAKHLAHASQVAALINQPMNDGVVEKIQILDIWTYLNWLEALQIVGDISIVKNLIIQIFMSGHGATLDSTYEENGGAEGTLYAIDTYGIDIVLNSFGLPNYVGDKVQLVSVLREVLTHAVTVGLQKESAKVILDKKPARVSVLFDRIVGAPNAVSEKDIKEIIDSL